MIEIRVGTDDLARVRFAADPAWETAASLNVLAFPRAHVLHERLRRLVPRHPGFDIDHLFALAGHRRWIPDVLGPTPTSEAADPESRLAALADTEVSVAESDLRMIRRLRPETRAAGMSPDEYLATTAEAMVGYWREVLAPLWDRIDAIVTADIAHHRAALASQGLGAALPGMHEELSFAGETVRVALRTDAIVQASGRGVWFVPSVFRWPWISVDIREHEPVVSYAARGAGRVWEDDDNQSDLGLVELLGRSRAEILRRLDVPRSTTGLARDLDLSPSTVSWHLSVMSTSGLLASRREGRRVLYSRTLVGDLLVRGGSALEQIG
ncbi:MAG TPA: DUF5937 family protein [Nocardioides sp.]|nr:DUF5937 family protein [Nocardioides sp.]